MTIFVFGADDKANIKAAAERARKKPIPWEVLRLGITRGSVECFGVDLSAAATLTLADRAGVPAVAREPEQVLLPLGWRVAITCEEQPAGILLHVSMSSPAKGKVPTHEAMRWVIEACGYTEADIARSWLEEYEPGRQAVNVLVPIELRKVN